MSDVKVSSYGAVSSKDLSVVVDNLKRILQWKNYVIYGLVFMVLGLGIAFLWQRGTVADAKVAVEKANSEIALLEIARDIALANEKACKDAVASQNKAITEAGAQYDADKKKIDNLTKFIMDNIRNGKMYKDANDARNQTAPKTCEESLEFMVRNL
jgi:Holliday junction resolvase RusA-like endonuclease